MKYNLYVLLDLYWNEMNKGYYIDDEMIEASELNMSEVTVS